MNLLNSWNLGELSMNVVHSWKKGTSWLLLVNQLRTDLGLFVKAIASACKHIDLSDLNTF
jgi:hypothetical protein